MVSIFDIFHKISHIPIPIILIQLLLHYISPVSCVKKKKKKNRPTDPSNFQAKRANKPFIFLGLILKSALFSGQALTQNYSVQQNIFKLELLKRRTFYLHYL